jgi:hypothetical protein
MAEFFGFEFRRKPSSQAQANNLASFTQTENDDGALTVAPGGAYGTYIDLDGSVRTDAELVTKYREMSLYPEVDSAIDDIVNDMIVQDPNKAIVSINLDKMEQPDNIKKLITQEFDTIIDLYDFNTTAYDIARRWYIDGRLFYHLIVDKTAMSEGIKEIRYIDPRKIRKIREIRRKRDPSTVHTVVSNENEYYIFNERGFAGTLGSTPSAVNTNTQGLKIAKDSIVNVTSGLLDKNNKMVLGYLHKALKPLNNLRAIEDATVIYRISRAPERRVFYIDVGNLPKMKAEQYLKDIMTKFKNRVVYDSATGEIRDDRKFMTMLEDFWLPRREGGRGTEITTLPAGQNLGEMEDVKYFQRNLYKSLNVPVTRIDSSQTGFNIGKAAEITRDEVKFAKFIDRLRLRFNQLFLQPLRQQLILKGIITVEDWQILEQDIGFEYAMDNFFSELKESEIMNDRLALLNTISPYVGKYYSHLWVQQNVLKMSEEEIQDMVKEIQQEQKERPELYPSPEEQQAQGDAQQQ